MYILNPNLIVQDPAADGAIAEKGIPNVLPFSFYEKYNKEELSAFCVKQGLYNIPTIEMVEKLKTLIAGRVALEIGAGNGVLARSLGIPATDNFMQTWPDIKAIYDSTRQETVTYGPNVENLDAHDAIAKYKPEVVIAAWVTHKYNPEEHDREGNMYGVDESFILENCKTYIHIGNSATHAKKPIKLKSHRRYRPSWLLSRARSPELNEICIWGEKLPTEP